MLLPHVDLFCYGVCIGVCFGSKLHALPYTLVFEETIALILSIAKKIC